MKTENLPLVSIIIVNWNGGDVFESCLASLLKITYPNWELIVVDNGSNQKLVISNYQLAIKLIKNKNNLGFAIANNRGFEVSRGKYILLLNNDTRVEPDFLTQLVKRIDKDNTLGVIQPKIYLMDKFPYLDNAGSYLTRIGFLDHWGFGKIDGPEFAKEREIFSAKGACMLIRREVIEKVGLFDPDFISYFEESDFCWRVWLAGWKVLFYPEGKIYHKLGFTIRRLDVGSLNYHYYKNRISSLIKNLELQNLAIILFYHLLISAGIALVFLVKGRLKNSGIIFKAMAWNLINLPKILAKRSTVQKIRVVTDRELFIKLLHPIKWKSFFKDFRRIEGDIKRKI